LQTKYNPHVPFHGTIAALGGRENTLKGQEVVWEIGVKDCGLLIEE
jgi:hypothetical protein